MQKWGREVAKTHHANAHHAHGIHRSQDRTAILAELNYKGTDFNLDYKYISQEFLMKYHLGGKK